MANISESQMNVILNELNAEMLEDTYKRVTNTCLKKCISPSYKDPELNRGESVCLDRCIGKYLEIQNIVGRKIDEEGRKIITQGKS